MHAEGAMNPQTGKAGAWLHGLLQAGRGGERHKEKQTQVPW